MILRTFVALLIAAVAATPAMSRDIVKGSADKSATIRIIDASDGTPETGVSASTTGLDLEFRRDGGDVVDITEVNLSTLSDAHTDGGLLHISNGYYRLDLPDAAVADGADFVLVGGAADGMIVIGEKIDLVEPTQVIACVLHDGNDLTSGATLKAAVEAAPAGAVVAASAGTYDLDDGYITIPSCVTLRGAGVDATKIISSNQAYPFINLGGSDHACVEYLTIESDNPQPGPATDRPLGCIASGDAFTNALVRHVRLAGATDGVFVSSAAACSGVLEHIQISTGWDAVLLAGGGAHNFTFRDFLITGLNNTTANTVRGFQIEDAASMDLLLVDGSILLDGDETAYVMRGIACDDDTEGVVCANLTISLRNPNAAATAIHSVDGPITLVDCSFDRSTATGAYTDYNNGRVDLVDAPNSTAVAAIKDGMATQASVDELPSADDNAAAVWGSSTRTLTDPDSYKATLTYGAVEHARVAKAKIIPVSDRHDGTVGALYPIRMKPGGQSWWALELKGSELADDDLADDVDAPTSSDDTVATVDHYGPFGTLVKLHVVVPSEATAGDTCVLTCNVIPEPGDVVPLTVTVEVL